jgi:drug/metabolite transporter (DMT)-like permease
MHKIKTTNNTQGIILGVGGYSGFVFLDSLIKKYLVDYYPVIEINFLICLFSFIPIVFILFYLKSWNVLINNKVHFQLFRGVLGLICGMLIINSFKNHALTEIYPILFSTPLILTIFSYFFLKEKVGLRRVIAVLLGFLGVLIVSRPGTIHFTWSLFGLFIAALILATNVIIIRKLAATQSSLAFAFYGSLSGLILSGLISSQNFIPIRGEDFFIFVICGLIAGVASLCISGASKILESSIFAPIQYVQLLIGFILGYLLFKDLPDKFEIIGSIIIISSGLFVIYRESKIGLRPFTSNNSRIRDLFFRGH